MNRTEWIEKKENTCIINMDEMGVGVCIYSLVFSMEICLCLLCVVSELVVYFHFVGCLPFLGKHQTLGL